MTQKSTGMLARFSWTCFLLFSK